MKADDTSFDVADDSLLCLAHLCYHIRHHIRYLILLIHHLLKRLHCLLLTQQLLLCL